MSRPRFETKRFHVKYGPEPLFQRVKFKMQGHRKLKLHAEHFEKRLVQRKIKAEIYESLVNFNTDHWDLVTAEIQGNSLTQLGQEISRRGKFGLQLD